MLKDNGILRKKIVQCPSTYVLLSMVAHRSHRIFNINIYKKTKKRRIYEIKKNIIKYKIKNILKNVLN